MANLVNQVGGSLILATKLAVVAGIVAVLFSIVLSSLPTDPMAMILINIAILVVLAVVLAIATIDNLKFVPLLLVFFAITIVGSIIQLFIPSVSEFILTIGAFEVRALLLTVLYIVIAQIILRRLPKPIGL